MEKLREWVRAAHAWTGAHWQMVIMTMALIIVMQQCTIGRLRFDIEALTETTQRRDTAVVTPDTTQLAADTATTSCAEDSLKIETEGLTTSSDEVESGSGSIIASVLLIIALLASLYLVLRHRGVYPFGHKVSGKLYQQDGGDIYYELKVNNPSARTVEAGNVTINFYLRSGVRRFRASVQDLPITLQPGTSYTTSIKLTGLLTKNPELTGCKAVSLSLDCNGVRRTTIPRPVKFSQANY